MSGEKDAQGVIGMRTERRLRPKNREEDRCPFLRLDGAWVGGGKGLKRIETTSHWFQYRSPLVGGGGLMADF